MEERAQDIIGGQSEMEMRYIEQVLRDGVDPTIHAHLSAAGTESGFTTKRNTVLKLTAGAHVARIAGAGVAAEQQALNGFADVGTLVSRDFVCQAQITPGRPMLPKDFAKAVMAGRAISVMRERE